jgi:mono/diheme cytochrome c family protein
VTPTAEPTEETVSAVDTSAGPTWDGQIGALFEAQCASCHGTMGGLSVASYADLLAGGANGVVIVPGDPAASSLVSIQEEGEHMGQFSEADLALVKEWVTAGALESGGAPTTAEGSVGWDSVSELFDEKCISCHGTMGGLSLASYADVMAGGTNGEVVVPGDSSTSLLVTIQEEGGHMGQFSDEEIQLVKTWINAGAEEVGAAGGEAESEPAYTGPTWETGISELFADNCAVCHGEAGGYVSDFSVETYEDLVEGGVHGQALIPGDPDSSLVVEVHYLEYSCMGKFEDEALQKVIDWITAGAP